DATLDENDTFLGQSYLGYIDGGGDVYDNFYAEIPYLEEGQYYLLFVADFENSLDETNENNNVNYTRLNIGYPIQGIDLMIPRIYYELKSDTLQLELIVRNNGMDHQYDHFSCFMVYSNDSILDEQDEYLHNFGFYGLYAQSELGQSYESRLDRISSFRYLLLMIDPYDSIAESNEWNNWHLIELPPPEVTDLGINMPFRVEQCRAGDTINVPFDIVNYGIKESDDFEIFYYLSEDNFIDDSDILLLHGTHSSVAYGETVTTFQDLIIPDTIDPGSYQLIVYIAAPNELGGYNNQGILTYYIQEQERVYDIAITVPSGIFIGYIGDTVHIEYTIDNLQDGVSDSLFVSYYISRDEVWDEADLLLGSYLVKSIDQGASLFINDTLLIPDTLSTGSYTIILVISASEELHEINEENNLAYLQYQFRMTGISDHQGGEVWSRLYPNPTSGMLYMKSGKKLDFYKIIDSAGKMLRIEMLNGNNEARINVEGYTSGLYYLYLEGNNYSETILFEVHK
ncbi:CARDB domain-containing protein, partial [Bacteroidota bacterium]